MESPRYDITVGAPERAKLCISTAPINPHTDIQATQCFEVYIRDVLLRLNHTTATHSLACIYTPDGHCTHTLQPERLAILYAAYVRTLRKKPQLFLRLGATTFAEEVYKLLTRYAEDASATTSYGAHLVKHQNNWSTPPSIYNILSSLTSATKERFASPLNFNPVFSQYWSAHERDQLFGAQWDSFRYAWTGSSVNNPEYEDDSLNRNMAYDIDSCLHSDQPVLCAHILPAWTDRSSTSYMTWVREFPDYCLHLLQIPSRYFRFVRPTSYEGTNDTYAANPKWDVNIILTGNKAGFRRCYDHEDPEVTPYFLAEFHQALQDTLPSRVRLPPLNTFRPLSPASTTTSRQHFTPSQLRLLGLPNRFKHRTRSDSSTEADNDVFPLYLSTNQEDTAQFLLDKVQKDLPATPPLRYDWTSFAYTDGSHIKQAAGRKNIPKLGAAVYLPPTALHPEGQSIPILPHCADAVANTINRAELIALYTALRHDCTVIATDSLVSIYQIRKQIHRPQDHSLHLHQHLLQAIADCIVNSPNPIHLVKVKSHIGIVGNEEANDLAQLVALGDLPEESCLTCTIPSHNRTNLYWPQEVVLPPGPLALRPQAHPRKRPIAYLSTGLQQVSCKKLRLGAANRTTFYFEQWHDTATLRDNKHTNHFLISPSSVTASQRNTAIRYRTGTLFNRKLAHRYRLAPHSRCLLCNREDSGHHTAAGCPKLTGMYTYRHDQAARQIVKAILRGRKSGFVVMMDIGNQQHCEHDDLPPNVPHRIPANVLPPRIPPHVCSLLTNHSRPDIFLFIPPKLPNRPTPEYIILELKYCRDTDPQNQYDRAISQHRPLADAIQQAAPHARVTYIPLLLGVAGTIYSSTTSHLRYLGVRKQALPRLLNRLHVMAITNLHWIYTTKRHKERHLDPQFWRHTHPPR